MTTSTRGSYPKFKALHPTTNLPLSGGLLYTYTRGTTTAKTTYSDIGKTTAHANPIVLDSAGETTLFLDGSYKWVLKDSAGTTIWTQDDINVAESTTALASDFAFGLVTNGSFEDDTDGDGDPDGWTATEQGTVALDATDANHGAQCLKFTSTGSGGGYIVSSSFMEVSANNTYSIIFSVKSSVADIRNLVTVSWYDLDQVIIAGSPATVWDDSATNPTSWTEKRFSVTPATGACFAKLSFYGCHSSDATSGNTKYDYIRMFDERVSGSKVAGDLAVTGDATVAGGDLTITLTDAAATAGPTLTLHRDSVTDASDADLLGTIVFSGLDDGTPSTDTYATLQAAIVDSGSGSEDGSLTVQTKVAGTLADRVIIAQGVQIGSPTGTDKGVGTLNLDNDLYKDGTNITTPAVVTTTTTSKVYDPGHVMYVTRTGNLDSKTLTIGGAARTCGPTGSGADEIWTALDGIPATALAIIADALTVSTWGGSATSITAYTELVADQVNGSTQPKTMAYQKHVQTADAITSMEARNRDCITIPVDSSNKFMYFINQGTTAGYGGSVTLSLVGWVDTLI